MAIKVGSQNTYLSNINENLLLFFLQNEVNLYEDLKLYYEQFAFTIKTNLTDEQYNQLSDEVDRIIELLNDEYAYIIIRNSEFILREMGKHRCILEVWYTIIKIYIASLELKKVHTVINGVVTNKGAQQIQEFIESNNISREIYPKDHPADLVLKLEDNKMFGISLKQTKRKRKIGWKNPGLGTLNKVCNKTFNTLEDWNNEINIFRESGIAALEYLRRDKILIDKNLDSNLTTIKKLKLKEFIKLSTHTFYDPNSQRWAEPNSLCSFIYAMGKHIQEMFNVKLMSYYANIIIENQDIFLNHLADYWFMVKNQYPNYCKLTAMGGSLDDIHIDIEHLESRDIIEQLQNNIGMAFSGKTGFVIGNLSGNKGLLYVRNKWNSTPIVTSYKFSAAPSPSNIILNTLDNFTNMNYNSVIDNTFNKDNLIMLQEHYLSGENKL